MIRPFIDGFVPKAEMEPLLYKPVWTYQKMGLEKKNQKPEAANLLKYRQPVEKGMNKDIDWTGGFCYFFLGRLFSHFFCTLQSLQATPTPSRSQLQKEEIGSSPTCERFPKIASWEISFLPFLLVTTKCQSLPLPRPTPCGP